MSYVPEPVHWGEISNVLNHWKSFGKERGYLYMYIVGDGEEIAPVYVKPGDNHGKVEQWCNIGGHVLGQHFLSEEYECVWGEIF